ncbi:transposase family protein, partial [Salmonella enterica]|nr:transposase family protein [Salmonella enterica]
MPSLKTLLQLPYGRQTIRQTTASGGVTIHLQATRKTGHCPEGMKHSTSVHSRRRRRIQHLPCSGQNLWLIFAVRHRYCRNPSCSRKIFAESLEPFAGPRQQASQPLKKLQYQLGLIAGG